MCTEVPASCMIRADETSSLKNRYVPTRLQGVTSQNNYIHGHRRNSQTCHKRTLDAKLTHTPGQWATGFCPGEKWQGSDVDHSVPFSTEVKNEWIYNSGPTMRLQCVFYRHSRIIRAMKRAHDATRSNI
jgi:hypothetical protein